MHNTMFIVFGVVGLILIGAGQVLIKNSVKEVPQHSRNAIGPNIPGFSMGGPWETMFGNSRGTTRQNDSTQRTIGVLIALIAHVLVAVGAGFYAVGKNRSPWFGLLGFFTPIGLLFLCVLKDKSPPEEGIA
jgi:hypothetical protein